MTDTDLSSIDSYAHQRRRRCPRCRSFSQLTHAILDSRHGNVVRLYHCAGCGEHLWDDGSKFLAEAAAATGMFAE